MAVKAVVFDIGGVLEYTPTLGVIEKWEEKLGLKKGEMNERLHEVWRGGSIGTISTEAEVHQKISEIMGLDAAVVSEFMEDTWVEYLGTLNGELADYFRSLRPRYQTAIISNSFVGAREREHAAYGFGSICDFIIYSHEVGFSKPDPRIYQMTWERLGVQPGEMIFLDDREGAIEAANALGIKGVLFQDNAQAIAEIEVLLKG
jgi:epoxide hydrolase-like predicted phosphatase